MNSIIKLPNTSRTTTALSLSFVTGADTNVADKD
jgi:hypothetical protein